MTKRRSVDRNHEGPSETLSDLYTQHIELPPVHTRPARQSIHVSSVQICEGTTQADQLLGKQLEGFAYQRDGHANEYLLAERCRQLHQADFAAITPNGMSALALALLSIARTGDQVLVSHQVFGKTKFLFGSESARLGIRTEYFDVFDIDALQSTVSRETSLIVVETISNPLMRVADIRKLSEIADAHQAVLLVDNTFASPVLCRPLALGAHLVMESLTKIMNGHSDLVLGVLCGRESFRQRVHEAQRTWGLVGAPFECWLADRGIGTANLRVQQASRSALQIANFLLGHRSVQRVFYPGLVEAVEFELAKTQFQRHAGCLEGEPDFQFGHMLSFDVGSRGNVDHFIRNSGLLFCPSLGDLSTTVSYPTVTSHRGLSLSERLNQGISEGLLRVSIGIEPVDLLFARFDAGLASLDEA